ncbi:Ribokinase-like protein [Backusella circina FSU 941]|nr:Ribokinase-like protein [Backusella circina FSU 941]
MAAFSKTLLLFAAFLVVFAQVAYANIYSQLQFIKISEPKSGQDFEAGKQLTVKYVMQPLIQNDVSLGKALSLDINFHTRTGDAKQQKVAIIHKSCPVAAKDNKYVTYTKSWTIPKGTKPGSYAVDFVEQVQLRRTQITSTETSGETLSSTQYSTSPGGKGANQSVAIAKAGGKVYFAGSFGKDGSWIKGYMSDRGVDMTYSRVKENETNGRALIQVSGETGDNCIVLYAGTNGTHTLEEAESVLEHFEPGDWIIQQNEINLGGEIMKMAAKQGLKVCFNPAPMTKGILDSFPFEDVSILVVNEHEAKSLYEEMNCSNKEHSELDLLDLLFDKFNQMQGIVITLGGEGLIAKFRNNTGDDQVFQIPGRKVAVKDTTAAGDTFVGYFLAALTREEEKDYFERVKMALHEANFASAISVQREGSMVSVPTLDEVHEAMKRELN